ncbi:MAG: polysaccharide biosynthesis/export family protein [Syntrophobacteraceae bacterium]
MFHCIFIFLLASLLTACQTSPPPLQPYPEAKLETPARVTLKAGDVVEIKFAYAGQFNENQTIRPDGKIEMQLIGEVVAEGKTPSELRDELVKLYSAQLKHPELAVVVRGLYERRVYVGGEVNKPGPVDIPGEMTALEAIMLAGGFNLERAEVQSVIVARNRDGRWVGQSLDFKDALAGQEAQPFYLQPRDIVYVPRTTIADVDLWMQQHFWRLLPPIGVGVTP